MIKERALYTREIEIELAVTNLHVIQQVPILLFIKSIRDKFNVWRYLIKNLEILRSFVQFYCETWERERSHLAIRSHFLYHLVSHAKIF